MIYVLFVAIGFLFGGSLLYWVCYNINYGFLDAGLTVARAVGSNSTSFDSAYTLMGNLNVFLVVFGLIGLVIWMLAYANRSRARAMMGAE